MNCTCPELFHNSGRGESVGRNWNPDCLEHGTHSEWYNSSEQRERRAIQSKKLIEIQRQAAEARKNARYNSQSTD